MKTTQNRYGESATQEGAANNMIRQQHTAAAVIKTNVMMNHNTTLPCQLGIGIPIEPINS
jgi:hypothetical protein